MKKKILVTGSTGYLGSYLVKRLLDNYRVIGLDIVKPKKKYKNFTFINKKISDISLPKIKNLFAIIHCGTVSRNYSKTEQLNFFDDLFGLSSLSKMIEKNTKFIFFSTNDIHKSKNQTSYQKFKSLSEEYLINLQIKKKFILNIIRPSTFYSKDYPKKNIAFDKIKKIQSINKNFYLVKNAPKLNIINIDHIYTLITKLLEIKKNNSTIFNLLNKKSYSYKNIFYYLKKKSSSKSKLFFIKSKKSKLMKLKEKSIILNDKLDSF